MFKGKFLDDIFMNSYLNGSICKIETNFFEFIKESFISDLIMSYNETGLNKVYFSKEIIPAYYKILKRNEKYLSQKLVEINPSTNQENYRIINRNVFSSNSGNKNGLQNRVEIECVKVNNSMGYKLSPEILKFSNKKNILDRMIFTENFSYLFNFRTIIMGSEKPRCSCGEKKNIFIKVKRNDSNLPIPISDHVIFKCVKCLLAGESDNFKNIIKGD